MTVAWILGIGALIVGAVLGRRYVAKLDVEAANQATSIPLDQPCVVQQVSYFHAPFEYGVGPYYGRLTVSKDHLVLEATGLRKLPSVPGTKSTPSAVTVSEAEGNYRLDIPRAAIKRFYRPTVNFGIKYNVELTDGTTDEMEVPVGPNRKLLTMALVRFGYPMQ